MKHIIKNWLLTALILYGLFGLSAVSAAGTWEVGENLMPTRRWGLPTSVVNGRIYAIGGQDDTPTVSKVEEYDTEKDAWTEKADIPTGRFRHATAVVGGKIYAIGGWEGSCCGDRNKVEVYTPDGWPFPKAFLVSPQGKLATVWGRIKQNQ